MFQASLHRALAGGLLGLAMAAPAAAFEAGDVYWLPVACDVPPCHMTKVDASTGIATPFASLSASAGQFAWSLDLSEAYSTQYFSDEIHAISSAGGVTTFATGISSPTGLLMTSGGMLLAVSFTGKVVYDASDGGSLSGADVFASGFFRPRNLLQLSTGEILLSDQNGKVVYDITGGGDFSGSTPFAYGFTYNVYDLVESSGAIYLSSPVGVYDITGGGDFSGAAPFAFGRHFIGLAVDGAGRLLASEFESGGVYDITSGGDQSAAVPVVMISDGLGDSALDAVPDALGEPPDATNVPVLGPMAYGALVSLLAATGRRRLRRDGFGSRQRR